MKQMQAHDASRPGRVITGVFVKDWGDAVTIDDARGVRYFVMKKRIIEQAETDLFGPLTCSK